MNDCRLSVYVSQRSGTPRNRYKLHSQKVVAKQPGNAAISLRPCVVLISKRARAPALALAQVTQKLEKYCF